VLEAEAKAGTKRIAIAAPGFSADCLETLEELAIRGREQFLGAGGKDYAVLGCLNAGEAGMAMLETLVRRELSGWLAA
jgi:ferrochelatase